MRWTHGAVVALSMVSAASALVAVSCTGTQRQPAQRTAAETIAVGKRLTLTSGCQDCHTPGTFYGAADTTRALSGSELGWEGPWGVSYARNLTPDVETGLGNWSEADIVTAIRTGQRPDKSPLLPPMPWTNFAHLTDEDAYAIAAYLKSLPPVRHEVPKVVPPGTPATGPRLTFPPPPAWDAQNLPPPPAAADTAAAS